jgi:hypothetical protein
MTILSASSRTLQSLRLIPWRAHPDILLFIRDQDFFLNKPPGARRAVVPLI